MPIVNGKVVQNLRNWVFNLSFPGIPFITFDYEESGEVRRVSVDLLGGACKLQWKVDWAMRWMALGIDYEMHGKDLISSAEIGIRIANVLGWKHPVLFRYELFLDEQGQKISKSRGNGITLVDWDRYAVPDVLWHFLTLDPTRARKVGIETVMGANDIYLTALRNAAPEIRLIHGVAPPAPPPIDHSTLLTVIGMTGAEDRDTIYDALRHYHQASVLAHYPVLENLIDAALAYYQDRVKPTLIRRPPTESEQVMLADLISTLEGFPPDATAETIQTEIYEVGKRHYVQAELRRFFQALYEILVGRPSGPRFGHFVTVIGRDEMIRHLRNKLATR
jgi:lysyl-tRNA synthetase class 1